MYQHFQVLADPNRFHIVELLRDREHGVNDLVARLDIEQSGVSRHLRILEESGFVRRRAEGAKRLYSLVPDRFDELDRWIEGYRKLWLMRFDNLESALRKKQQRRSSTTRRKS